MGSFLAKYSPAGKLLWYRVLSPIPTDYDVRISGGDIAITNGYIFLTGNYAVTDYDKSPCSNTEKHYAYSFCNTTLTTAAGDMGMFFSCIDLNGDVQWVKKANSLRQCNRRGSIYYPPLLATDKNNNLVVTMSCVMYDGLGFSLGGDFIPVDYVSDPYGSQSLLVLKYNSSGSLQWSNFALQKQANPNSLSTKSIATDKQGNIFINSKLNDSTQFGTLMFRTTSNDAYYQQSHYPHFSSSVLAKISASGTWQFVKEIASITNETDINRNQNLVVDNSSNVYLTTSVVTRCNCGPGIILGDTLPPYLTVHAFYLVKMSNTGQLLWKKTFGGPQDNYGSGLLINNNKLYMSGALRGDANASYVFSDLTVPNTGCDNQSLRHFVARADTSGTFKWVTIVCGGSNMEARSITVFNDNVFTGGDYRGSVNNLGHLNGTSQNGDGFVLNHFLARLNDQYINIGTIAPLKVCAGSTFTVPFTAHGLSFSANNIFTAEVSDESGNFTNGVAIGSTNSTGSGDIIATVPPSVSFGKTYRIRIRSSDTLKTGFPYYVYADKPYNISITCPSPNNLSSSNITDKTATVHWGTVSCGTSYQLQVRRNGITKWQTIAVTGSANSYNLDFLKPNRAYQWRIATICQSSPEIRSAYSSI